MGVPSGERVQAQVGDRVGRGKGGSSDSARFVHADGEHMLGRSRKSESEHDDQDALIEKLYFLQVIERAVCTGTSLSLSLSLILGG